MVTSELLRAVRLGKEDEALTELYGADQLPAQRERYAAAIAEFASLYGEREVSVFTVAGRSEISGNHTDHNHGCVIAASIDLDIIAVAARCETNTISIKSEGFPRDVVSLSERVPDPERYFTSGALIAGVAEGFCRAGLRVGGFVAYTTSNVLKGSGLSSSAAFEDMVGNILNYLYNDGSVDNAEIAKIAQFAENEFFGKPCGLMDQVACAVGGFVSIDFADPKAPVIQKADFDLAAHGYALCIVSTGGNHADLNEDYASVPAEMRAVAQHFGQKTMRGISRAQVIAALPQLRESVGDRAILRALHFLAENDRVAAQSEALKKGDLAAFFDGVIASGISSFCYLQNVYTTKNVREQGLSLALNLAEGFLRGKGAWRVHGGGFAGTVQCYVPLSDVDAFRKLMDGAFGAGACHVLNVRAVGAGKVL